MDEEKGNETNFSGNVVDEDKAPRLKKNEITLRTSPASCINSCQHYLKDSHRGSAGC